MPARPIETLDLRSRAKWRQWLRAHHESESEIWLVFHKRHTGVTCIEYADAVEEAICFGWIDSLIRKLDEDRFARKFTLRKADSRWSTINRKRYAEMESRGLLTAAGRKRPPTKRSGDAPKPVEALPTYIEEALKREPRAWEFFQQLAPSYRQGYVAWIDSAKREETKLKRLREAISLLAAERKLGMK